MRVHRVRLTPLSKGSHRLTGSEAHHLIRVLRVKEGASVRAFDGQGLEAEGVVTSVEETHLRLSLDAPVPSRVEPVLKLALAFALLKGDKMAEVVRQTTELGVSSFQPFISRHCDVPKLSVNKLERLRRVAQEAAKQSGRSIIPEVAAPVALTALELMPHCLVADPNASTSLAAHLEAMPELASIQLLTGPEGGFSAPEIDTLKAKGAKTVYLGARILRAQTAPVALAAALLIPEAL